MGSLIGLSARPFEVLADTFAVILVLGMAGAAENLASFRGCDSLPRRRFLKGRALPREPLIVLTPLCSGIPECIAEAVLLTLRPTSAEKPTCLFSEPRQSCGCSHPMRTSVTSRIRSPSWKSASFQSQPRRLRGQCAEHYKTAEGRRVHRNVSSSQAVDSSHSATHYAVR